jgi:hypothetical protein
MWKSQRVGIFKGSGALEGTKKVQTLVNILRMNYMVNHVEAFVPIHGWICIREGMDYNLHYC